MKVVCSGLLLLITTTSCRKDPCNWRCPYLGNYAFVKHEYSTCNDCPPEANLDTTYYFNGSITLSGQTNLNIDPVGEYYFRNETQTLMPGPPPYFGNENPKGYFVGDTIVVIKSHYNYWGHSGGWTLTGTKVN